jgi:[acyl-carrier-protein] S-malonyltransferase
MKIAFLFPGQGSQHVGMAKDLFNAFDSVRELYERAEEILGFPLKRISFEGPGDTLGQTQFTQPAIFVHSLAMNQLLKEIGILPQGVGGHSLGEYSALVCGDAVDFDEGLRLVKLRGELMQHSGEDNPGTMAAIIGLSPEIVGEICEEASDAGLVQVANFNSPGQVVISGSIAGVRLAMELAKEQRAERAIELRVSGAFHSPLMGEALSGLIEALATADIRNPQIPVYTNVTAHPVQDAEEIRSMLQKQLLSPVLWKNTVENMIYDGFDTFYEVGPAKVLSGLSKRINPAVDCMSVGKVEDLENLRTRNR